MSDPKAGPSNQAGPAFTREQLGGADPKLAAAFLSFAEKLGHQAKRASEQAPSDENAQKLAADMQADAEAFMKQHKKT